MLFDRPVVMSGAAIGKFGKSIAVTVIRRCVMFISGTHLTPLIEDEESTNAPRRYSAQVPSHRILQIRYDRARRISNRAASLLQ